MELCNREFYSLKRITGRFARNIWSKRKPLVTLVGNLASMNNARLNRKVYREFNLEHSDARFEAMVPPTGDNLHVLAPSEGSRKHGVARRPAIKKPRV
jgi:hypothetical protein